jgi:hypothetical protein
MNHLQNRYGGDRWRCVRHVRDENDVLSPDRLILQSETVNRQEPYGRFFGNSGFFHGPGFKAFAEDFPAGTIIRVTAEVILPAGGVSAAATSPAQHNGTTPPSVNSDNQAGVE